MGHDDQGELRLRVVQVRHHRRDDARGRHDRDGRRTLCDADDAADHVRQRDHRQADAPGLTLVALGPVGGEARHGCPRLREPEGDALAGQRVDVAGRVTHQQHPARGPRAHPLPQRTCPAHPRLLPDEPLAQHREVG